MPAKEREKWNHSEWASRFVWMIGRYINARGRELTLATPTNQVCFFKFLKQLQCFLLSTRDIAHDLFERVIDEWLAIFVNPFWPAFWQLHSVEHERVQNLSSRRDRLEVRGYRDRDEVESTAAIVAAELWVLLCRVSSWSFCHLDTSFAGWLDFFASINYYTKKAFLGRGVEEKDIQRLWILLCMLLNGKIAS